MYLHTCIKARAEMSEAADRLRGPEQIAQLNTGQRETTQCGPPVGEHNAADARRQASMRGRIASPATFERGVQATKAPSRRQPPPSAV